MYNLILWARACVVAARTGYPQPSYSVFIRYANPAYKQLLLAHRPTL